LSLVGRPHSDAGAARTPTSGSSSSTVAAPSAARPGTAACPGTAPCPGTTAAGSASLRKGAARQSEYGCGYKNALFSDCFHGHPLIY